MRVALTLLRAGLGDFAIQKSKDFADQKERPGDEHAALGGFGEV